MDSEQFKQLQDRLETGIAVGIEKHVNGKIRKLDEKLTDYIKEDIIWKAKDKEWKEGAQPSVSLGSKVISFADGLKYILATGIALAGFVMAIKTINNFFK